ncbi:MAG: hypothetical protein C0507_22010 [Cyanobacteria bacterium PR.3.49]|nr:hypothetical protein [Cyanobacteria bacterium PR.3.49]
MISGAVISKQNIEGRSVDRSARGSAHVNGYMKRLQIRTEKAALKNNVIFGLTFGWVLTLMGVFKSWILLEGAVANAILGAGLVFLATTLIAPGLMVYPQRVMKAIATFVGTNLFKGVLCVVYFLTILPAGLIYQKQNNHVPFYSWTGDKAPVIEGWTVKESSDEHGSAGQYKLPGWLQPLQVVAYFARHSQLLFLPCLIVLLMLGMIGIFVQSSALAPFIYTLF